MYFKCLPIASAFLFQIPKANPVYKSVQVFFDTNVSRQGSSENGPW